MLPRDIITMAISITLAIIVFACLFRITKSNWRSGLRRTGFILGFIGAIGFVAITFINMLSRHSGWYGELSIFILSSSLVPLIILAIFWKWELIGGPMLTIETLILGVLPYGITSFLELTPFTSILYQLSGFMLLLSGSLIIHAWKANQTLTPEKRYKDLHSAGLFIGLVTVIVLVPAFLSAALGFVMAEQSELAILMLIILLVALTGVSLAWKLPCISGWIFIVVSILDLFTLFAIEPYFMWKLPLIANITIVSLLPVSSGTFLLISCREESYIRADYIESTSKLMGLNRKEVIERWKKQAEQEKKQDDESEN
jgi:hypothetical protein